MLYFKLQGCLYVARPFLMADSEKIKENTEENFTKNVHN